MRVFLDDVRPTPDGWIRCYWPGEVIDLLKTGKVEVVSLDHDLGDDLKGTGYDVVKWIEEAVIVSGFNPPKILIHSSNPAGKIRMEMGIASIQRHLTK